MIAFSVLARFASMSDQSQEIAEQYILVLISSSATHQWFLHQCQSSGVGLDPQRRGVAGCGDVVGGEN